MRAIFSIKPEFAKAIIDNKKKIEFRKKGIRIDINEVIIYSTSPVKRILGFFYIDKIVRDIPDNIWKEFGNKGCINKESFFNYYLNSENAYAILIKDVIKLREPINPRIKNPDFKPPRSFHYTNLSIEDY